VVRRYVLYMWLAVIIIFGRELLQYDLFVPGIKWNHLLCGLLLFIYLPITLYNPAPYYYLRACIVMAALISTFLGWKSSNMGVFFNLNFPLSVLFFGVGYNSITSRREYIKLFEFLALLFFITYVYKEIQFTLGGTPLLFGFSEIRMTRDFDASHLVKGSSDSLITIGNVALLFFAYNKSKWRYILFVISAWILLRYGVRTAFFSTVLSILSWKFYGVIFTGRYRVFYLIILPFLVWGISRINLIDSFYIMVDIFRENGIDKRETFIWRLASWIDSIQTSFDGGLYLIGESGRSINYNVMTSMNFREYLNPHNSYVYLLLHFGSLSIAMLSIVYYKVLKVDISMRGDFLLKVSWCASLMYIIFPLGSPVLELIHQGPLLWFLLGCHTKYKRYILRNNHHLLSI
jgi:hypothetical protein